jgi:hypothetical protein
MKKFSWVLPKEDSCIAPDNVWSNKDMDPSPDEHRTWTGLTFFTCGCDARRRRRCRHHTSRDWLTRTRLGV